MKTIKSFKSTGFTLVELLVSLAILSIILTIGIGLVLTSNASVKQSRSKRKVMDNMTFALESMSRAITYGNHFGCYSSASTSNCDIYNAPPGSPSLYFKGSYLGNIVDISYEKKIDFNTGYGYIARTINGGDSVSLTDPKIDIKDLTFFVSHTDVWAFDHQQPRVTVVIRGFSYAKDTPEEFFIQTTLSQRDLKL